MNAPVMLLAVLAAIGLFFVVLPVAADTYIRHRDRRTVACPETGLAEEIELDAWHAAVTSIPGPPCLYVAKCSGWPRHMGCRQRCVAGPVAA